MSSQWQLQPIFGSYLLVLALAGMLLLALLIRPAFGNLSPQRQRWLLAIRALVAILMLLALLRPARIRTERRTQVAQLLILLDASRSMGYRDGDGGVTRWDQQLDLLRKTFQQLAQMGENFDVEWIAFSDQIQPQEATDGKLNIQARPIGPETDLGKALRESTQRHAGKRLAAVVLISDGAQRVVTPETPPQQAARQLHRQAVPLYTITLGQSRDRSQSRDVAVENLQDEYSVFVKNELALRVGIRIQGYVQKPIPVSLIVENEGGPVATLGPVEVVATRDSEVVMAEFAYRPDQPGQFRLRVQAAEQPGELTENNQMVAFLNVKEGGLRVLLLTSGVLQEQKFIRRALSESGDIELDYQPISIATRSQWPIDLETLVSFEDYDVVLVGDLDASALRAADWDGLAKQVERGGGLMMYGGYHSFGPGGYADTALADVLPIKMNRLSRQSLDPSVPIRSDRHIAGPLTIIPKVDSSVTYLAPDQQNLDRWRSLKPLLGANRFDQQQLKDTAVVLAESQGGDPLLVQSGFVEGRVLAFAGDTTYRWWRYGQQDAHKKFWRQSILWLARRDQRQANAIWLNLAQRRFRAESRITFETGLADERGDTVIGAPLDASLTLPDGSTQEIPLGDGREGSQGLITQTTEPGIYRLEVKATEGDTVLAKEFAEFAITKEDYELSDPAANPGLMDQLAGITKQVGGRALAPEQLAGLLAEIKKRPPRDEIETESKWQLGDTPWDAWGFFLLLVTLLTTEWFLRKRWGLV